MLEDVKDYLRITWPDEDAKLTKMIARGKTFLNSLVGLEMTYNDASQEKTLLLDYCRYAYNNATEYFEENYHSEILRLQLMKAADDFADQEVVE